LPSPIHTTRPLSRSVTIVKDRRPPVHDTSSTPIQRSFVSSSTRSPNPNSIARPSTFATVAHDSCAICATAAIGSRVHSAAMCSKNRRVIRNPGIANGNRSIRVPPQHATRVGSTSR
jgi:hypothetical protein